MQIKIIKIRERERVLQKTNADRKGVRKKKIENEIKRGKELKKMFFRQTANDLSNISIKYIFSHKVLCLTHKHS